jgi:hypothetical protein
VIKSISSKLLSNERAGKICLWMFLFTCFYYPISASFILILNIPSTIVNIFIRAFCAFISLYLIFIWTLNNNKKLKFKYPIWFLLLFWIFYSIRIIYDLNRGIKFGEYENTFVYGFAFGNILLPMLAILLWYKHLKTEKIPKLAFLLFSISNIMILINIIILNQGFDIALFLQRSELKSQSSGDPGGNILNPISIGYYGELLVITSLYFSLLTKHKHFGFLAILGILLLLLGASRGPFVNCIFTILILLAYKYRISKSKLILTFRLTLVISLISIILSQTVGKTVSLDNFYMFDRLSQFVENRQSNEEEYRDVGFASAWNDFLDSPIIGNQFVGTYDNFYPHNIFVELFMATGLLGVIIFSSFFFPLLMKMRKLFLQNSPATFFILLIFLPIILGSLFSGALFQAVELWLFSTLIIVHDFDLKSHNL